MTAVISAEDFTLELTAAGYARPVLEGISFEVRRGSTLGIVGESGSGKSLFSKALLGDFPAGARTQGKLVVSGTEILDSNNREIRELRQQRLGIVFQDPKAAVNPVHRIGDFLTEQVVQTGVLSRSAARKRAIELLGKLQLRDPEGTLQKYSFELSGGMLQRVVIAAALMGEPDVLICDEATTALDVTTQAEIVRILRQLTAEFGVTLLFITHDLELAGDLCDELCVMYAGQVLEHGPTASVLTQPKHPYTQALLRSTPRLQDERTELPSIPGVVLPLTVAPTGCVFADRCAQVTAQCREGKIPQRGSGGWKWQCVLPPIQAHKPEQNPTQESEQG